MNKKKVIVIILVVALMGYICYLKLPYLFINSFIKKHDYELYSLLFSDNNTGYFVEEENRKKIYFNADAFFDNKVSNKYNEWKISFKDWSGKKRYIFLRDNADFNTQMKEQFEKIKLEQLVEEQLSDYFEIEYYDNMPKVVFSKKIRDEYDLDEVTYIDIDLDFDIDFNGSYEDEHRFYKSVDSLMDKKKIVINEIKYISDIKENDTQYNSYVNNLTKITKYISEKVYVKNTSLSLINNTSKQKYIPLSGGFIIINNDSEKQNEDNKITNIPLNIYLTDVDVNSLTKYLELKNINEEFKVDDRLTIKFVGTNEPENSTYFTYNAYIYLDGKLIDDKLFSDSNAKVIYSNNQYAKFTVKKINNLYLIDSTEARNFPHSYLLIINSSGNVIKSFSDIHYRMIDNNNKIWVINADGSGGMYKVLDDSIK